MPTDRTPLLDEQVCFRYRIVTAVRALELGGTRRHAAVRAVCADEHVDEAGQLRRVSERTLYRWLSAYSAHGLCGLSRKPRARVQGSKVLPPALLDFLAAEREGDRDASIPELLRRAELREVIASARALDRGTVWRAMQRLGIETRRRKVPQDADQRRFRYPSRMQMVLADFKHFRAGVDRVRRAAIYLLDDASRYGLDVRVATSEKPEPVLRLLHDVICRHGMMDLLYWDGGPGFVDKDVLAVCANLQVGPIRGRARYPEGHGAIERFNRSAKARVLRSLDGAVDVDVHCAALTLRLRHDLYEVYNHLPHESLDGDSPHQRFWGDTRPLHPARSAQWLREGFTVSLQRRVSKDHIVQVFGTDYEVPRGHAGQKEVLVRRLLECTAQTEALYLRHHGRLVRLHPVDLAQNARTRRAPPPDDAPDDLAPVPAKSASAMSFERDLPGMLDPDGGYPQTDNDKER
ncbi:MAG: transposase [Oligoflexia bacterium]|nr:transposase [Oligoflexia bacterium]